MLVRFLVWWRRKAGLWFKFSISCKAQARWTSYTHISNHRWQGRHSDTLIGQRREETVRESCCLNCVCICVCVWVCVFLRTLTLYDVSQALCVQKVLEASHLLLQLTHQTVAGVLVDHGVAADLFGTVSIPGGREVTEVKKPLSCKYKQGLSKSVRVGGVASDFIMTSCSTTFGDILLLICIAKRVCLAVTAPCQWRRCTPTSSILEYKQHRSPKSFALHF